MKQSSKRLVSMVLALVLLVAAFLIFFELIQPTYADLETMKGEEAGSQSFLQNEQTLVTQAKNLLTQYENQSQGQANLALAMPSGPDIAGALAQVYGIATNNNITVSAIAISAPSVEIQPAADTSGPLTASEIVKPVGTITFSVTAAGSYESLKAFLAQLETNVRIFDVTGLSLQSASNASAAKTTADFFTYNVTAQTYYQLP